MVVLDSPAALKSSLVDLELHVAAAGILAPSPALQLFDSLKQILCASLH